MVQQRSRKFDLKKPLLVFKLKDIPLADQNAIIDRNIPTFATGVEKEEEEVCFTCSKLFFPLYYRGTDV